MGQAISAEFLKLRTTRMWWGLLITAVLLCVLFTALTAGFAGQPASRGGPPGPGLESPAVIRSTYAAGFGVAYLITLVLGIIGVSGEYRHKTVTPTFLAVPHRGRVIQAKLVVYLIAGLVYGIVGMAASTVVGALIIRARGFDTRLTTDDVPRTIGLCVLAMAVWAIFGLGLGTLIKNQVAAILVALGATLIAEPLLVNLLLNRWDLSKHIAEYLPGSASSAIVQGASFGNESLFLPWWGGALVLIGYGVVFSVLGVATALRRDVS